ncbi:MAG: AMP-dependent synthetase/ligase [Pseudomonadota bacterium]|nr:AMP-dependent synthetase/ligase [Pseudomonadota bacterium]
MRRLEHFPNLVTMFFTRAEEKGDAPFLWSKHDGAWQPISWRAAADTVARLATALQAIGLERGDRVMLVSENRPEWCLADLAIMAAGCVTVPTYTTNTERDHAHIIENSGAKAVIVSTAKLARTLLPAILRSIRPQMLIGIEPMRLGQVPVEVHDWQALIASNRAPAAEVAAQAGFARDDLACIIYTSGTGGAPRGVMQHHGAILHNVAGCSAVVAEDFGWGDEVFLSFLPLSHAYEHTGGQHFPIGMGGQIYYAEGIDKLAANIEEVRPTIMFVVPRLFEVLRMRISKTIERQGGMPAQLLTAALDVGAKRDAGRLRLADRPKALLVDTFFKPKIARKFGGRLKAMISGGAPLTPEVGLFFQSLGLTFLQGYGQTEAAPVISCNRPSAGVTMDSVGPPLADTEVRIAEDGEILVRGELVMTGYWGDDEATTETVRDGWLHTGDIGVIESDGYIRITDRKKDIIVNSGGDNISPQRVEGFLTLQPEIAQAMVYGDRKPHLVAVIVPEADFAREWAKGTRKPTKLDTLVVDTDFKAAISEAIERVNADLPVIERVRRFMLRAEPFTIENEQLTPSLKIRRHKITDAHLDCLESLYAR